jgi:hypothetical protein
VQSLPESYVGTENRWIGSSGSTIGHGLKLEAAFTALGHTLDMKVREAA